MPTAPLPRQPSGGGRTTDPDGDETLRAILGAALDCIVIFDADGFVTEWNPVSEATFGITRADAIGKDVAGLVLPPELQEAHRISIVRFRATGRANWLGRKAETLGMRRDGTRFPIEIRIGPVSLGGRMHYAAHMRDIGDRRRVEALNAVNEERLQATYENAFAGIAEVDRSGTFLRVNEEFCRIVGCPREELIGSTFMDATHPDDVANELALFEEQMRGIRPNYALEKRGIRPDGAEVWVEVLASAVGGHDGIPAYGVRVVRDVTDRKRSERERTRFVRELNHRVKNTLAVVQGLAAQTMRCGSSPEKAQQALTGRLLALAEGHDVLSNGNWEGAAMTAVAIAGTKALPPEARARIGFDGPAVLLAPQPALAVTMVLHELATNAFAYGALSEDGGKADIAWDAPDETGMVRIRWVETDGPPVVRPDRRGFGMRLIERSLGGGAGGEARITFAPGGLRCDILLDPVQATGRSEA